MKARFSMALAVAFALAGCATEPRVGPTSASICPPPKSDAESNKAAVLRLNAELWDKKNPEAAMNGIFASDLMNHAAIPEAQGAAGMRTISRKLFAAFPDLTFTVTDLIAEGDRVVLRVVFDGTQTGSLDFKPPVPATGKHARVDQVHTFRFKDGKIVESWMTMDHLDLMKQLGLFPTPRREGAS
jgi:predicted ester cyclase